MKLISAILITIVSGSSAVRFGQRDSVQCEGIGLRCSTDCKTVEYCPKASGTSMTIRECAESTFCANDASGVPECNGKSCGSAKPNCPAPGAIPSVLDCHVYYICSGAEDPDPMAITCPNNGVYNTKTSKCDATTPCRKPVECAKAGDYGVVDPEANVYCYYCSEINTPYIYPCKPAASLD